MNFSNRISSDLYCNCLHVMITVHAVKKLFRKTWYIGDREIMILIMASELEASYRLPLSDFSFTDLRLILNKRYYKYEIYRSLKILCDFNYVKKKSRNVYRIDYKGRAALHDYSYLYNKEHQRISEYLAEY